MGNLGVNFVANKNFVNPNNIFNYFQQYNTKNQVREIKYITALEFNKRIIFSCNFHITNT